MEVLQKLKILADAAKYDASCASSGSKRAAQKGGIGNTTGEGICHSYTPDGRCVSLLKILLTNYCVYDCQYCTNRVSSDVERARFTPEEVVELTLDFYKRNYIEGLFLSSGVIRNADYTMELVTRVAKLLRETHKFGGYIHLKAAPGAAPELLREAGRWADRISVNVELPTPADLAKLAPEKKMPAIESSMGTIAAKRAEVIADKRPRAFAPAGQSTQMVIGATPTADREILRTATHLYKTYQLRRVYYSAYSPIDGADARLPAKAPPLVREHRLYEADWLVRFYGFKATELTSEAHPNLDLDVDPKMGWALRSRAQFPVDVNRAPREMLLRVPGLGIRNVEKILRIRPHHALTLVDLARLRVSLPRVRPWIITADYNPGLQLLDKVDLARKVPKPVQLSLFASTGEL